MCVSWATYDTDKTTDDEDADIVKYSVQCAQSGGSLEFNTTTTGNGLLFRCASNRAKGCEQSAG
jgi:putative hemolysin